MRIFGAGWKPESGPAARALSLLSACADLIAQAGSESQLLDGFCALMTRDGNYRLGWVGHRCDDDAIGLQSIARSGDEFATYDAGGHWRNISEFKGGPAAEAIRNRAVVEYADLAQGEQPAAWRTAAVRAGLRSVICLPLNDAERTIAVLVLYRDVCGAVPPDELQLLLRLSRLLVQAVLGLRARVDRDESTTAMMTIARALEGSRGDEFLGRLCNGMVLALGADAGFVVRLAPSQAGMARVLAGTALGETVAPFDYPLDRTPCERTLLTGNGLVCEQLRSRFPGIPMLEKIGAEAYVASRLDDFEGHPIGLIYVLYRQPLLHTALCRTVLPWLAIRAAGEIARQEADERLIEQAALLDKAHDAIIVRDIGHHVQFWNAGAERLYGWAGNEALGRSLDELALAPEELVAIDRQLLNTGEWSGTLRQHRKDGSEVVVEGHWTLVRDAHGQPRSILEIDTDITERSANDAEMAHLAFYDALTGLPNRLLLLDRLHQLQISRFRSHSSGALLFIDLDNFKTFNDTLGHDVGDQLLQQVAQRLTECVRTEDTVGRLAGDEFVVVLSELDDAPEAAGAQATAVAEKILHALRQPFLLGEHTCHSTASVGVTLFGREDLGVAELLKRADFAMYQSKVAGRDTVRFFAPDMQVALSSRALLETQLRRAESSDEFVLHYQSQVDHAGKLIGIEALLRWRHPTRGMLLPAEFLDLAEHSSLIVPLGRWVLASACAQLAHWQQRGLMGGASLSVNISARQFRHPGFVADVLAAINDCGVDPHQLKLEITESALVADNSDTAARMARIKSLGIGLTLDEFGTGYCSLAYLKALPIDQLKIDRSFVSDVVTSRDDLAVIRSILAVAGSFGLDVIAAGVENRDQRDCLAHAGCERFQGFLFNRPMPAAQFGHVLAQQRGAG
ncbi:diguanylate cyclase (GGDEF)-like protein/PAS domain S-box-containing protein [Actimicrobium sp. GrIS 1.19]|uniref:bifunctional diguanylate cyclase/phosphodiesterase n=1 Tax=Actimicrobium sp. GrIS 1.19 TaxID=3071708 RepID=UPI002E0C2DFF|nr:diguanylate cyclase (GGDEF)-like protein/PAS domain S-box-containing protein [Actimicrobium sp. GrIS 1.19]